eukprot:163551_1
MSTNQRAILTTIVFISFYSVLCLPQHIPNCIDFTNTINIPCSMHNIIYISADCQSCGQGSYGTIIKVRKYLSENDIDPTIYAMKFSRGHSNMDLYTMNENEVTKKMMDIITPVFDSNLQWVSSQAREQNISPTIRVYDSDYNIKTNQSVLVMDYHSYGNIWNVKQLI